MTKTINGSQMRNINRSAIFEFIRSNSPTSRTEISQSLHVSLPTVMRILDGFMEENLVLAVGSKETELILGRKRELLAINNNAFSVLSIDLGGTKIYGAYVNMAGEILLEDSIENHNTTGEETYVLLTKFLQQFLNKQKSYPPLKGISIGVPGIVITQSGIVNHAPSLNWKTFPLGERIEKEFGIPVYVENDVNLSALGEFWFGAGKGMKNMFLMAIGTGVGSGLILDGSLFRGSHDSAGEIGYYITNRNELGTCYDKFGAFENKTSGLGIATLAKNYRKAHGLSIGNLTAEDVFDAIEKKESWAIDVLNEFVDLITIAISNTNTLLDLDLVVLSGGVSSRSNLFLEKIQKRMQGLSPNKPVIYISTLNRKSTVMGGVMKVIHGVNGYVKINNLS